MTIAVCCVLLVLAAFGEVVRAHLRFQRRLAQLDAAAAAGTPCPALSHIRILPQDEDTGAELAPSDDLFVRMVAALNSFAESNGYEVPVPLLWMAIASVIAEAILGEDLAGLVAGPGASDER